MFTIGFCCSLASAYYRYHQLANLEKKEKEKEEGGEELKNVEDKA